MTYCLDNYKVTKVSLISSLFFSILFLFFIIRNSFSDIKFKHNEMKVAIAQIEAIKGNVEK